MTQDIFIQLNKQKQTFLKINMWKERGMYDLQFAKGGKFGKFPSNYVFLVVNNTLLYNPSEYYDLEEEHQELRENLMRITQDEHRAKVKQALRERDERRARERQEQRERDAAVAMAAAADANSEAVVDDVPM